jgi:flagellar protein FliO/FliZ
MTGGMDGFTSLFFEIGGLVLVLWIALWLFARRGRSPVSAWGSRDCQILRQVALGPRERVIVVRIGLKQIVLGVSAASVSLICELDEPLPETDAAGGPFGDAIRKAVGRWRVG